MKKASNEGGFMKKIVIVTVAACIAFVFLFKFLQDFQATSFINLSSGTNYTSRYQSATNPLLDFGNSSYSPYSDDSNRSVPNSDGKFTSPYAAQVRLSSGSASQANQTYEEYVTLTNSGAPINITGWVIANGKGSRPIENTQISYAYPVADSATIGQGTEFVSPDGKFQVGPIVLKRGDTAILQTGRPFSQFPFALYTSFRENMCMGYLDKYPLAPQLSLSCPFPTSDPFIRTVTDQCYDYLNSLARCQSPQDAVKGPEKDRYDLLTSQCKSFVTSRLNYQSCVENNRDAQGFSTNQWRVFLNRDRELWASSRETITLYDAQGYVVDRLTY
ncbi:MAG: hypothetical protein WC763_03280 [Candidatus Paceibacterota bacterium]